MIPTKVSLYPLNRVFHFAGLADVVEGEGHHLEGVVTIYMERDRERERERDIVHLNPYHDHVGGVSPPTCK